MKKLSYLLLATAVGVTAAAAEKKPFNGYYLGADVGYTQRATTTDLEAEGTAAGIAGDHLSGSIAHRKRSNGVQYGLYGGHGWANSSNIYMGLEVSLHNDTLNRAKHHHTLTMKNERTGATADYKITTRHHRGLVFGLAPRIGMMVTPNDVIYAKVAVQFSKDRITHQLEGQGEWKSQSVNQTVLVPGIGYEHAFGNVIGRIEYGYNCGANLSARKSQRINGAVVSLNQIEKYTAHEIKVGVSYQF